MPAASTAGNTAAQPPGEALARGWGFLRQQAEAGFPDACHAMSFPHAQGFTGASERQASDLFARAVIGGLLLDLAELAPALAPAARPLAAREAAHVAAGRVHDRAGGWSYFPGLPELPPDLDSLGAASALIARAAPGQLALCQGPIALALARRRADAGIDTWLVAATDPPDAQAVMQRAIALCWGSTEDVDVLARFYRALRRVDPSHADAAAAGARHVAAAQRADGAWQGTWYAGPHQATALCAELLAATGTEPAALARAGGFARAALAAPGLSPVDTALCLWTLRVAGDSAAAHGDAVARLVQAQCRDGGWPEEPWIEMAMGRARGRVTKILTWGSRSVASALCLRGLAAAGTAAGTAT